MTDLHTISGGDVAIRADESGDGRTLYGYAYRWGELAGGTAEYGETAEGFDRGAFLPAIAARGERPWPFLDTHKGRTVAGVRFAEDDIGLRYEGRLLDTTAASDYAATVPAGNDGVSLEFMYRGATSVRRGKSIIHTAVPRIAALAGVYVPAYGGATVALRDDTGGSIVDEITPAAVTETEAPPAPAPLTASQVGMIATDAATEALRGYAERGAFGGPKGLGDTAGLTLSYAYMNNALTSVVAAQSAEKAEIESIAVDIALGTEALVTYAGGSDISYQVLRRGSPSVLDAFSQIVLAAWAAVTDAAAATELESGSVTVDFTEALSAVDLTELTAHAITASLAVEAATGTPAEFILASTTAFTRAANLIAPSATSVVVPGGMDLRGLKIDIGGLPIIHAAGITAGKFIASNRLAGAWYEDGPFQASAEDVEHLGRDVAYWSLGAFLRTIPAGIVEIYDVTP